MKLIRLLPRFREADRSLSTLAEHESWSRQQIADFHLDAINALWKHAIDSVPYYQRLSDELRLPDRFEDLDHFHDAVPSLSKDKVRQDPMLFRSQATEDGFWCRTGGSTGEPLKVFWGTEANREMLRTKYRAFQMWGIDYLDRIAFLWGHSTWFQPGLKGRLARLRQPAEDYLRNRLRLSAYHVGQSHLSGYLQRLHRFRPVALYGYPTAIRLLADQARRESFSLDSLRLIIATGEPIDNATVEYIQDTFNAPTIVEYGSVDCGHLAHEWPDRTIRVREDFVHLETVEREQSRHSIVVTPLHNFAFPLIRFDMEDVSSRMLAFPEQGFAKLHDVMGRSNDFLLTSSDDVLHSARLDAMFKYQCQSIRRFRVHQQEAGNVDVFVELDQPVPNTEQNIEKIVFDLVGFPVRAKVVDEIELTQAGKHRILVSDFARRKLDGQDAV